jgi:diguanylate cyclase (GGDEF)-like protein/PAS domain S-box-containing protein
MKTIVIVDDSAANLKIYSKLSEAVDPDVHVRTFRNPLQAIEWLELNEPDLVITDYKMPRMNGAEFTRRIRTLPGCADVPVLVVTAYSDRAFRIEALEAGATDFLLSPIDHAEFQPRVRNLLRLSTHQRLTRQRAQALERELQVSEHLRDQILRDSHAQLAQVIDTVPAMISATDPQGRSIFVNAYQSQVLGEGWRRHSDQRDALVLALGAHPPSFEERITDQNGEMRTFLTTKTSLRGTDGTPIGVLTTSIDITDRKHAEGRLVFQAEHDQLTSLPNRYYLNNWLANEVDGENASRRPFALYYIDLDRFKYVNDGLGHHFGDQLLQAVSRRLQEATRHCDVVARLGGDEFAILQVGVNSFAEATPFAERINKVLQEPFVIDGKEITTSASIGVTIYPWDGKNAQELLQNADLAMYRVKAGGRNGAQPFTEDMLFQAREETRVRSLLYGALSRGEFVLYYQPQIDLRSGLVVGAEALIRWSQGADELLAPAGFLRIAEESDIMRPIDEWVLREACRQAKQWFDTLAQPIRVSVNLSAQTFRSSHLSNLVLSVLDETGLAPELLELELTEDVLLDQGRITAREVAVLHERGVRLSIDDFGTGHSSMARLSNLPIDTLKIDRSFVANLGERNNMAIIRAVVSLGHALNADVLAEGVETADQLEQVRKAGCGLVQGYFTCRPMAAEHLEGYLERLAIDVRARRSGLEYESPMRARNHAGSDEPV